MRHDKARGVRLGKDESEYISRIMIYNLCGVDWTWHGHSELRTKGQYLRNSWRCENIRLMVGLNRKVPTGSFYTLWDMIRMQHRNSFASPRTQGIRIPSFKPHLSFPHCTTLCKSCFFRKSVSFAEKLTYYHYLLKLIGKIKYMGTEPE